MNRTATIGVFDGLHLGHRHLLDSLRRLSDSNATHPLAVTFDRHPLVTLRPEAAPRLLMSAHERAEALRRHDVDVAIIPFTTEMSHLTAREFMELLHRDYDVTALHLGFNHRFGSDRLSDPEQYRRAGRDAGIDVTIASEYRLPDGTDVNSSMIRRALSDFSTVAVGLQALGHPYRISGTVVHGRHIGTTIGFPTANLRPDSSDRLIPAEGVYAACAILPDGERRNALLNIGRRPTFDAPDAPPSIEAHLIDFDGDLYGKPLALDIIAPLRRERRFASVDDLVAQLTLDRNFFEK
ncbi:MAG: riboflavin biosynthesis protein RibF [Paramuribaculum sp.]|nr:riboflavin biosynthesis protein RibF [Paramuribaculum sp.]